METEKLWEIMEAHGYYKLVNVQYTKGGAPYTFLAKREDDLKANDYLLVYGRHGDTYVKIFSVFWAKEEEIAYDITRIQRYYFLVTDPEEKKKAECEFKENTAIWKQRMYRYEYDNGCSTGHNRYNSVPWNARE